MVVEKEWEIKQIYSAEMIGQCIALCRAYKYEVNIQQALIQMLVNRVKKKKKIPGAAGGTYYFKIISVR